MNKPSVIYYLVEIRDTMTPSVCYILIGCAISLPSTSDWVSHYVINHLVICYLVEIRDTMTLSECHILIGCTISHPSTSDWASHYVINHLGNIHILRNHRWLIESSALRAQGTVTASGREYEVTVTSKMLWPPVTTNYGDLWPQDSVCDFKEMIT